MRDDDLPSPVLAPRARRLEGLTARQQDELVQVVGEAAVDLWLYGEAWPDLVERCLEAVEEPDETSVSIVVGDATLN